MALKRSAAGAKMLPSCIGTGFVALDILLPEAPATKSAKFAGGSCANVLAILGFLGWRSILVARLKNDANARLIIKDLKRWGVEADFIMRSVTGTTPVVVQRNKTLDNGVRFHKFEFKDPESGAWLPRFRPIPIREIPAIQQKLPETQLFFTDRATKASLVLARNARKGGKLVHFEAGSDKDECFEELVQLADIVKYSHERLRRSPVRSECEPPFLEIQTLGQSGLRYRTPSSRDWRLLKSIEATTFVDAAGAGDWCSAGLLDVVGRKSKNSLLKLTDASIEKALRFGQALASLNCSAAGARGLMYKTSAAQIRTQAAKLISGNSALKGLLSLTLR